MHKKVVLPTKEEALPGRQEQMPVPDKHFVNNNPLSSPFPDNSCKVIFGLGCFWGAEKKFWELDGVFTTAVGYAAGHTENATYEEVCSGMTGHNEVVLVVYDPEKIRYQSLLKIFWEAHDPTQGMQQGNDVGTQYRSGIYTFTDDQYTKSVASRGFYQHELGKAGYQQITTEILEAPKFYYAEDYHQQYLAKNPSGYCGLGGTSVDFPVELIS